MATLVAALLFSVVTWQEPTLPSVFLMPLEAREGVSRSTADQVGDLLAVEMSALGNRRVLTTRDIEGAMTITMRAQMANCDSTGCATEIAAALNTDEVVVGSLGKLGQSWFLTLSRVQVRGAAVLGRVGQTIPIENADGLQAVLRGIAQLLFGPAAATPAPPAVTTEKPAVKVALAEPLPVHLHMLEILANAGALSVAAGVTSLIAAVGFGGALLAGSVIAFLGIYYASTLGLAIKDPGEAELGPIFPVLVGIPGVSGLAAVLTLALFPVALGAAVLGAHVLLGWLSVRRASMLRWTLVPLAGLAAAAPLVVMALVVGMLGAFMGSYGLSRFEFIPVLHRVLGERIPGDPGLHILGGFAFTLLAHPIASVAMLVAGAVTTGAALVLLRGDAEVMTAD